MEDIILDAALTGYLYVFIIDFNWLRNLQDTWS